MIVVGLVEPLVALIVVPSALISILNFSSHSSILSVPTLVVISALMPTSGALASFARPVIDTVPAPSARP